MNASAIHSIPLELRDLPQWVLWREVVRGDRPTKIPLQSDHAMADSTDPKTWTRFDVALGSLAPDDSGIGFVFSKDDPYCGIDLDGCRSADGTVSDWAKAIILDFGSYAEVSPSGTGVKLWVRGKWNGTKHKAPVDAPPCGGKAAAIEVYDRDRYFATTGQRLSGCVRIFEAQEKLDALAAEHFASDHPAPPSEWHSTAAVVERARKYIAKMPPAISGQSGHNATFRVACILVLGFELSESEAYSVLAEWNACCQPPWSERELQHKIDSAAKQPGPRGYLRTAAPQNYDRIRVPTYTEPNQPLPERTARRTTLRRAAEQYIERIKAGKTETLSLGIEELNHAIGGGVEFGELVIFAGRPSHGKSAVALQMIHHWTAIGLECAFISEEMSAIALGKRAIQFASGLSEEHWRYQIGALESDVAEHFDVRKECHVIEQVATAEAAAAAIRRMKDEHGVQAVVVDYAQLLSSPGRGRVEQVTNTSIALRRAANDTGVLLLALCQLNRTIEGRKDFVPHMSDLRDTGQLEQDADVIVFGVWPHRVDSRNDPYAYQFFIAKNRNRAINAVAVDCRFQPSRQRFLDVPSAIADETAAEAEWHPEVANA